MRHSGSSFFGGGVGLWLREQRETTGRDQETEEEEPPRGRGACFLRGVSAVLPLKL